MLIRATSLNTDQAAKALELTPGGKGANEIRAHVFVQGLLAELPIPSHKRQSILLGPDTLLINRFALLEHVSKENRVDFFKRVISQINSGTCDDPFLLAVLTRAGHVLKTEERRELLVSLSQEKKRAPVSRAWVSLARSAQSFGEAQKIIKDCGIKELLARRNSELKEYVANIPLLSGLRRIPLPSNLSKYASRKSRLDEVEQELLRAYKEAQLFLEQHRPWSSKTSRFKISSQLCKDSVRELESSSKQELTLGERNKWLRTELAKLAFQLKLGLSLSPALSEALDSKPWQLDELKSIFNVVKKIGEYRIVASPSLVGFRRCSALPNNHTADCSEDGLIYLTDVVFDSSNAESRRQTWGRSPEDTIAHEMGHALSLRPWWSFEYSSAVRRNSDSASLEDLFRADHFPSIFLRLSRWSLATEGYELDLESREVTLNRANRIKIPLDTPHMVDGELRVYVYDDQLNILQYYNYSKGEFPGRLYSRSDPSETLAELYTSYFAGRQHVYELIKKAPKLFLYMEALYHRFSGDEPVKSLLKETLQSEDRESRARKTSVKWGRELGLFKLLSPIEMRKVASTADVLKSMDEDLVSVQKAFLASLKSPETRELSVKALQTTLSDYKPALLWARALLDDGEDVCVVSIRGNKENDLSAQEPIKDLLWRVLGDRFDERAIFFLNDVNRSRRLGTSYHKRLESLLPELMTGVSPRAKAGVETRDRAYNRVVVYSAIPATVDYLKRYVDKSGTKKQLQIIDSKKITAEFALAANLDGRKRREMGQPKTLHVFTLEETLLDLPAEFRVLLKGTERILARIPVRKFLTRDHPKAWLEETARIKGISRPQLVFDDRDFTSRNALRSQINQFSGNEMFKVKS